MRIPQKRLAGYKPQFDYIKNNVRVQLYIEPIYCVNIIDRKSKQCFPLTQEQYFNYCKEADECFQGEVSVKYWADKTAKVKALKEQHPDMIVFDKLIRYYYDKMAEVTGGHSHV